MAQQKRHHKSGNKSNNRNHGQNRNDNRNRNDKRSDNRNRNDNRNNGQENGQGNNAASKKENAPKAQSKTESSNDLLIFIVFLIALATFFLARKFYFTPQQNSLYTASANLKFMKEGTLTFLDAQTEEKIMSIDIEVAQSAYEIERGLMHRRSLPANGGMLFIFDRADYRTFWMKNTYLSLDIIYLNEEKEIIRISKETTPLSERSIPSGGKAMYVVEVLAGFTDAYQIHIGDHIDFNYK